MKFFMYGVNMLLRNEADGEGSDLGGAGEGEGTGEATAAAEAEAAAAAEKENEGKTPEEIKAVEAEAAAAAEKENEGKTPEEIKAAEDAAAAEKAKSEEELTGAPENYEDFVIPKEYENIVNADAIKEFSEIAKGLDLNQEEAQKLVDYEMNRQEQAFDAYTEQTEGWADEVKSDKEIGGADHELKMAVVAKSFKALATDEFSTLMNPYHPVDNPKGLGLGNHPEVVRLFYRIGLKMSEDGLALADVGGETKLSRETVMYGNKEK